MSDLLGDLQKHIKLVSQSGLPLDKILYATYQQFYIVIKALYLDRINGVITDDQFWHEMKRLANHEGW